MAAVTPDSVRRYNVGELTLIVAELPTTADTTNTWASGIPNIVFHLITVNDTTGTQGSQGAGATRSGSDFTVYPGEDNTAMTLAVFARC
jgi:hypothetical protein